jgi:WD40 repeat protein
MEQTNHHDSEHNTSSDMDRLSRLLPGRAPDTLLPTVLTRLEQTRAHFARKPSVDVCLAALNDPEWQVRTTAIQALGAFGEKVPIEPLVAAIGDNNASVRAAAIKALGSLGERAPLEPLLAALNDPEWLVREITATTLGLLGRRVPVASLVAAVHDENAFVCRAAALALVQSHLAEVSTPALGREVPLQNQGKRIPSPGSSVYHATLNLLATCSRLLFTSRPYRTREDRRTDSPGSSYHERTSVRQPITARRLRSPSLLTGSLAILLVIVSIFFAWLPRVQTPSFPMPPYQAQRGNVLFTYQGGQGIEGSPVWSSESKYLALLSSFGYGVQVWNLSTRNLIENPLVPLPYVGPQTASAWSWSPNGRSLAVTSEDASSRDASIQIWDVVSGRITMTVHSHANGILHMAWSPDGKRIAYSGDDGVVQVWDPLTGQKLLTLAGHPDNGHRLFWSVDDQFDNQFLLLGSPDGTWQLWNAIRGTMISTFRGEASALTALSPDGRLLVSSDAQGTLSVWNTFTGREVITYQGLSAYQGLSDGVSLLEWSPESRRVLAANDGEVQIWDAITGETLLTFPNLMGKSLGQSLSTSSQAFTANESEVQVWDPIAGQILLAFPNPASSRAWQISPDGRYVAFASFHNSIQLWDLVTGRKVASYQDHTGQAQVLAWSPDSQHLAFASADGSVFVLNVVDRNEVVVYQDLTHLVSLTWSPDGKFIAATSKDNTVHVLMMM